MFRLLLALVLLAASCTGLPRFGPDKKYDDNTGLTGVTTTEGSLAGQWGLLIEFATIINLPIVGDRNGGSQGMRILTRTWDAQRRAYRDSFRWCHNEVFEVEGTHSVITDGTVQLLRAMEFDVQVDHLAGHVQTAIIVNTWGIQNLPDPANTDLPTHDNYQSTPQSDWMLDEDQDGHPGVTVQLEGALSGNAYVVSRNVYSMDGTVITPDRVQGLARSASNQQHTVDADNRIAVGESKVRADPDPKQSWFDMVRLPDGAGCAEVLAAAADGRLATRRPF